MKEFNVTDYEIFKTATKTTENRRELLENDQSNVNSNIESLNDSSVFAGPICESIVDGWNQIKPNLTNSINTLNNTITVLNEITGNYKESDNKNSTSIGEADSQTSNQPANNTNNNLTAKQVIDVPEGLGKVHTYMGWQMVTNPNSAQYAFREDVGMNFDSEGFAKVGDRYVVACTNTYGKVGDLVDFKQSDGTVIKGIIGDIKSQSYTSYDQNPANKWGHNDGKCIVEFVVDKNSWYNNNHENPGNASCHPEWNQNIESVANYGSYYDTV